MAEGNERIIFPAPVKPGGTDHVQKTEISRELEEMSLEDGVLRVPAGVREIPDNCFADRQDLYEVVIEGPSELERIGKAAFCDCVNLQRVCFPREASLREIAEDAFRRCSALRALIVVSENSAPDGTAPLPSFPDSLERIGRNAFSQCRSLETLTLPPRLESIGQTAFFLCGGLRSTVVIPEHVEHIGKDAFLIQRSRKAGGRDKCVPLDFGERSSYRHISRDVLQNNGQCPICGTKIPVLRHQCPKCRGRV